MIRTPGNVPEDLKWEVYLSDGNIVLTAFKRQRRFLKEKFDLCSHSHEKDFLCQHNKMILDYDKTTNKSVGVVNSLFLHIKTFASNESDLEYLVEEFFNKTKDMYYSEVLLWCASLLIDFHGKEDCSEYMTLALTLKLFAYDRINFALTESPSIIIETLMEFLRYTSTHKCNNKLFQRSINYFMYNYHFDYMNPFLSEILEIAHQLRINFFALNHKHRKPFFFWCHSLLEDVERFLLFAKYGHEDQGPEDLYYWYMEHVRHNDWLNLFDFDNMAEVCTSCIDMHKYRCTQVVFLYIGVYYGDYINCEAGKKLYDETLRVLWETITSPYLTRKQFFACFEQSDSFTEFSKVWNWYARIVLREYETPEVSPRTLKHLSRHAIRRQLTNNGQLPHGVKSLDVPLTLKSYLRLEN